MSKTSITMTAKEYREKYAKNTLVIKKPVLNAVKKGRPALNEAPVSDSIEQCEGLWVKITLEGLMKGLNGSGGLMNSHWTASRNEKIRIANRIKALNPPKFKGAVSVTYTRYCSRYMDWDNMASTAKFPLDGLKNNGVIEDDSPEFIVEFIPKQIKARRKDARTEILIRKIKE